MSHNDASRPPAPPSPPSSNTTEIPDFMLLSIVLQAIAQLLLDHGSGTSGTNASGIGHTADRQEQSRQSNVLKHIAHILFNNEEYTNLHTVAGNISQELERILELLSHFNQRTSISVLDSHALHKSLSQTIRKLEAFSLECMASNLLHGVTSPKQ